MEGIPCNKQCAGKLFSGVKGASNAIASFLPTHHKQGFLGYRSCDFGKRIPCKILKRTSIILFSRNARQVFLEIG